MCLSQFFYWVPTGSDRSTQALWDRTFSPYPSLIGNSCWLNAHVRSHSDTQTFKVPWVYLPWLMVEQSLCAGGLSRLFIICSIYKMDVWWIYEWFSEESQGGDKAVQNPDIRIKGYLWCGWTYDPVDRDPWSLAPNANTQKDVWITKELTHWIWGENVERKRYLWDPLAQHPPFLPYCHQSQQALWSREGLGCLFLPIALKHENSSDTLLYTLLIKKDADK